MTYEIKLPQFEGPFDLLLFFIERDELDIYDIPIASITDDFLGYLHQMQEMNIDIASEFIVVAATLMKIKSKMLLPRKDLDEQGEEIDPRQELVDRLIEYKKYKALLGDLQKMEEDRQQRIGRGNVKDEMRAVADKYATEAELENVSLYKLLTTFEKILSRVEEQEEAKHKVIRYPFTIAQERTELCQRLEKQQELDFEDTFAVCKTRIHAIFLFLALLELIQQHVIHIRLGEGVNNFRILPGKAFTTNGQNGSTNKE